jgi:hypothetical protein
MTDIADIRKGIEQISTMVDAARRLVAEGHLVDLRSLETRVATFCSAIANTSPDIAKQLRPTMLALVDELGRLDAAVRQSQTETAAKLGETLARRRAATAYGSSPAPAPRPAR